MWKRKCTSRAPKYRKLVTNRQTCPLHISGQLKKSFVEEVASNWHIACDPRRKASASHSKVVQRVTSVGYWVSWLPAVVADRHTLCSGVFGFE